MSFKGEVCPSSGLHPLTAAGMQPPSHLLSRSHYLAGSYEHLFKFVTPDPLFIHVFNSVECLPDPRYSAGC